MKIVHASDWHGSWRELPNADLYILTGDMLPNFPVVETFDGKTFVGNTHLAGEPSQRPTEPFRISHVGIDRATEVKYQAQWCRGQDFKQYFGNPDAPILVVNGNHDFIRIGDFVKAAFEVKEDPAATFEFGGYKFGGMEGVPFINGQWNGEKSNEQMNSDISFLPKDLDFLITHTPPNGVLDGKELGSSHFGSVALTRYINIRLYNQEPRLAAHFFGHVHERNGVAWRNDCMFSNAATTFWESEF